jgi:hypothetical protein
VTTTGASTHIDGQSSFHCRAAESVSKTFSTHKVINMKRTFWNLALAGLVFTFSPLPAMAHWGHWSCGSYYSGYTYYYPRYYYPNYNNCSSYYGNNYYGNYGSYYGGYAPYSNYGFNSGYSNFGYNNFGLGGNNLLGLLAGSGLAGTNLNGSLLQPSYLSMPVSMGYGPSGFLQIPMGNPAGRATYLQIPVNTGYGPSSYLQIELGRNAGSGTPAAPTPSATPNIPPFGALPGSNAALMSQYTFDTPKTPLDAIPTAVGSAAGESAGSIVISKTEESPAKLTAELNQDVALSSTDESPGIQFVSLTRTSEVAKKIVRPETSQAKDTSFSLGDPNSGGKSADGQTKDASTWEKMAISSGREDLPWQAK